MSEHIIHSFAVASILFTALLWQAERVAFRQSHKKSGEPEAPSIFTSEKGKNMRKRNISIPIRVTEKELSVIDKKASKARLTRTEYLITCALGKEITLIEDLKPILADLRRIGNNLNQLTRLANMNQIRAVNLDECAEMLERTYEAIHELAKRKNSTWQHS